VANPKYSHFDDDHPIIEQFNIPSTIRSRFDLIFIFKDEINAERDAIIAQKILQNRGGIADEVQIAPSLMRKYIALAKTKTPKIPKSVHKHLTNFYVQQRSSAKATRAITARQFEAMARLSEAVARGRLSDKVSLEDVDVAINLLMYTYKQYALDASGEIDYELIDAGTSGREINRMRIIADIIKELEAEWDAVSLSKIQNQAFENHTISDEETERALLELKDKGDINEVRPNYYQIVRK
jgi:replicative DNA helicase Mcm